MLGMSSSKQTVLCSRLQVATQTAMADQDACIAPFQAWHAADVQALRARHNAVLADMEARLAAAMEQQQADMHAAEQAGAQKAAIVVDKLKEQYRMQVQLLRLHTEAEVNQVQSKLTEAQAEVELLQQALAAQHRQAKKQRLDLQAKVCSRLDHAVQQEAVC